jgi:hypothetical protein
MWVMDVGSTNFSWQKGENIKQTHKHTKQNKTKQTHKQANQILPYESSNTAGQISHVKKTEERKHDEMTRQNNLRYLRQAMVIPTPSPLLKIRGNVQGPSSVLPPPHSVLPAHQLMLGRDRAQP